MFVHLAFDFWRGGKFLAQWENFLTHEKKIQKREVQESLSEKKNRDDIDSPPQLGEFQYQLRPVFSTYHVTYKKDNQCYFLSRGNWKNNL